MGVGVWVPCDWLPGFAWVHWTGRDLAFALAFYWHVVGSICVPGCRLWCRRVACSSGDVVVVVGVDFLVGSVSLEWVGVSRLPNARPTTSSS